eukprot:208053-Chlamydomonas_euryale.AAC.1
MREKRTLGAVTSTGLRSSRAPGSSVEEDRPRSHQWHRDQQRLAGCALHSVWRYGRVATIW